MTKIFQKYLVLILLFMMTTAHSMPKSMCKTGEPLSNSTIEYYANSSLNSIFSFNFLDYQAKIPSFSEYLNEDAWKEYVRMLNATHLSSDVIKKTLIVNAFFKTPAHVLNKKGNVWRVTAPIIIHLQSATEYENVSISATLDIVQDSGDGPNCGLKISHIQFIPSPANSASLETDIDARYIPYKAIGNNELLTVSNDLKERGLDDESLIMAVNLWLLKQKNIDPANFKFPIIVLQKGVRDGRYIWRVQGPDQRSILVTRALNNQDGFDIQMESNEETKADGENAALVPNVFNDKNKIYTIKYPLNWGYQIKSPTDVLFNGPENISLVGISLLEFDQAPGLFESLASSDKTGKEAALHTFFPANIFTNLKIIQVEPITIKSPNHLNLPAASFVATYTSMKGKPSKLWGVLIARNTNPQYMLFLYIDEEEHYKTVIPLVKAMFNSLSIN